MAKTIDTYVVMEADDVMGVYDNSDEAERTTNNYYDAVVEGPEPMEVTNFDNPLHNVINVYVITEGDAVLGVYDDEDEAERMCNNYTDAEVSEPFIMEVTESASA